MTSPREKIRKARAGLIIQQPFYGSLALRLDVRIDPACETAWTDGHVLAFNPEFLSGLSLAETKGVIAHEVSHCALKHHLRRGKRDNEVWNIAADLVINPILLDSGFSLPEGGLLDPAYKGKSVDQVYAELIRRKPTGSSQHGQKGRISNGKGQAQKPDEKGTNDSQKSSRQGFSPDSQGNANISSDPGGCGEVRDAGNKQGKSLSPAEKAQAEREWSVAVIQAAQQAKACGKLPAGMDRLLEDLLRPRIDWRAELWRFFQQQARNDYTWVRPNPRYIGQGFALPSLRNPELGEVAFVLDTSGSVSKRQLLELASELRGILDLSPSKLTVIYCDAKIQGIRTFRNESDLAAFRPKGGGGTDYRPPFEWLKKKNREPVCLIYLTDGRCKRFPEKPAFPVLWVISGTLGYQFNPSFGEVIPLL